MTETTTGQDHRDDAGDGQHGTRRGPGLTIDRLFTTPGVHPYDQVTWERRDVVQTNWKTGAIVFEQRGVEFPEEWSVNASTIVTTKYFRGAVGTDAREWSLRQLIDRVVHTYGAAGREYGYFATDDDAVIFEHELTWMLLHQVFSFNSPVWFNVGTPSPQQVSACQPYHALVSTPGGPIAIGDLVTRNAIGAKVFDAQGLTKILAVKANGTKDVLRVHLKSGHQLDVTADHLVWRSTGEGTGAFVEAGELKAGDALEWHRRESFGEEEIRAQDIAEAALAGWLQSDGFVGQYSGTNKSLTIEAITVSPAELNWVTDALDVVFPDVHRKERKVVTQDTELDCRRTRLYGPSLRAFIDAWGLMDRGRSVRLPARLLTAPLPVVTAYLRSVFQAEGYVSRRDRSTLIGLDMVPEDLVRGIQALLARYGIFARVAWKTDAREGRQGGIWSLRIQSAGDRRIFADEIGFIDPRKAEKLERGFALDGQRATPVKRLQIARVENLGPLEVYDIQTESGEYLSGQLRVHNCFILSVDDTMDSILNWYREEGMIFKGGSGAGLNLSRIRSSKELLSSGGTASGPVSFMRGADASAGTIKSGGATRRAAKMVVLDVDHPDIEEFIETKVSEEEKIRVLRDAGFDMDLGGKDITSVQYQNANNSVRVSDAFMRAVEAGERFGLTARKTGEVIETVDAKALFRKMSEAAWACADPGIQYDDTINDWHTNPETGRITASNPCSEYMSLDNSSCNLASLNLLTFLRSDDTFDAETFARAVELVITAMDISICFADFPTESIGDTTRRYRQLGIGFANLGALLMATGLPYDSDGGRALAAGITSLMTGIAYKRSAELAGVVGPYEGYARNAQAHKRVMRKHAAASDSVRTVTSLDGDVLRLASQAWEDCLRIGDENGWRNAQASVLAPTGCLTGDTVVTTDRGLLRLSELGDVWGPQWQELGVRVSTDAGPREATHFFVNGEEPTRRLVTEGGYRIQGTLAHRVKVVDAGTGAWAWKRLADVSAGDLLPIQLGTLVGEPRRVPLPVLDQAYYAGDRYTVVPDAVDADLAELVGYFMGDGSLHAKGLRFCVADTDLDVVERLRILGKQLFHVEIAVTEQRGFHEVRLDSVRLARWWSAAGFAKDLPGVDHAGKGWTPRVPGAIRETNDPAVYAAFLRGLFEADGAVLEGVPSVTTASELFADDIRTLLLALGLPSSTRETTSGSIRVALRSAEDADRLAADWDLPAETGYVYESVAVNADGGVQPTYDLSVPDNVTYVANGFVSHNTIGFMMDCDTTGIEPDFSLVKFKKLVGGGSMQIVNQTIPRALRKLGYAEETVEAIVEYIAEHGHVVDAPGLKPEHYAVFDCAMGQRSITPMGHVRMMAAVQPFLSGAISKCVTGESLVATADGLVRIGSWHDGEGADSFRDHVVEVSSLGGTRKTDAFYYGGLRPVRRVVLRSGHRIVGTPNHRLLVAVDGGMEWRALEDLQPGDYVATRYGSQLWSDTPASLRGIEVSAPDGCQKAVTLPAEMTRDLAFLLGAYAAEGHTTRSTWTVTITSSVESVLERVRQAWQDVFGLEARIDRQPGTCPAVVLSSKTVVEFLDGLGCGERASAKRIPDAVLRSPKPMVLSFLQGLALDAYVTTGRSAKWGICLDSNGMLDDLQAVLTNLGVVHGRVTKHNQVNGKDDDEVYACGEHARALLHAVPFLEPDKQARAEVLLAQVRTQSTADVVPGISGRDLYALLPAGGRGAAVGRRAFTFLLDARTTHVSRRTLERVAAIPGVELPAWLQAVLENDLRFSPVESVLDDGEREVFDISVPGTHAFVANGIVNHNTVNMPESATVEDVEEIYWQGWKLGLKALAIYRDNCKVGQPLSDAKAKSEPAVVAEPEVVIEYRPVRKRLPKSRPSVTTSFSVAGAEGYMTAGSYPDDGLGELFLKLGKQGSTLAGVMDAFSIAVSIALQYGVPLEAFVTKFVNMRFDPAGLTDDPDVRMAQSIMDYIFRRLALDYLPYDDRAGLGIFTAEERARTVAQQYSGGAPADDVDVDVEALAQSAPTTERPTGSTVDADEAAPAPTAGRPSGAAASAPRGAVAPAPKDAHSSAELLEVLTGTASDAPLCMTCGIKMRPAGSCYVCEGCGSTSGCS